MWDVEDDLIDCQVNSSDDVANNVGQCVGQEGAEF